jgi:hypothetical protein
MLIKHWQTVQGKGPRRQEGDAEDHEIPPCACKQQTLSRTPMPSVITVLNLTSLLFLEGWLSVASASEHSMTA